MSKAHFFGKKKTVFLLSLQNQIVILYDLGVIFEDNVLSYKLGLNMICNETRISNVHSGGKKKLFYTFSHVINPKSLNLTSQVAVG